MIITRARVDKVEGESLLVQFMHGDLFALPAVCLVEEYDSSSEVARFTFSSSCEIFASCQMYEFIVAVQARVLVLTEARWPKSVVCVCVCNLHEL